MIWAGGNSLVRWVKILAYLWSSRLGRSFPNQFFTFKRLLQAAEVHIVQSCKPQQLEEIAGYSFFCCCSHAPVEAPKAFFSMLIVSHNHVPSAFYFRLEEFSTCTTCTSSRHARWVFKGERSYSKKKKILMWNLLSRILKLRLVEVKTLWSVQ